MTVGNHRPQLPKTYDAFSIGLLMLTGALGLGLMIIPAQGQTASPVNLTMKLSSSGSDTQVCPEFFSGLKMSSVGVFIGEPEADNSNLITPDASDTTEQIFLLKSYGPVVVSCDYGSLEKPMVRNVTVIAASCDVALGADADLTPYGVSCVGLGH